MDELDKLRQWLLTYPKWDEGGLLYIDYTDGMPGNSGLFPGGLEELSRKTDVLGRVTVRNRYHFALYRVAAGDEDNTENARWLLEFQNWIQRQSVQGKAPVFGDEPSRERICAQKGRLRRDPQTGTSTYSVTLTVDCIRRMDNG